MTCKFDVDRLRCSFRPGSPCLVYLSVTRYTDTDSSRAAATVVSKPKGISPLLEAFIPSLIVIEITGV